MMDFFKQHWEWVIGTVLLPIVIAFFPFLRNARRKRAAQKHITPSEIQWGSKMRNTIKKFINEKGVLSKEQMQSISSQYFLANLLRSLKLTDNRAYEDLINEFLGSFKHVRNEGYSLFDKNILVTPKEKEAMKKATKQEDENDNYFIQIGKQHSADNIDFDLMHKNYLYGLIVSISDDPLQKDSLKKQSLKAAFNTSIKYLIRSTENYGGWHPYRMPWVTARITISLATLSILKGNINKFLTYLPFVKKETKKLIKVISLATDSIVERVVDNKYWRDGTGGQVSKWESTGLCLEAILIASETEKYGDVVSQTINYILDKESDWFVVDIDFSSEKNINEVLGSVTLICTVLKIAKQYSMETDKMNLARKGKYLDYLDKVIQQFEKSSGNYRQHCTVPQILYYITNLTFFYDDEQ